MDSPRAEVVAAAETLMLGRILTHVNLLRPNEGSTGSKRSMDGVGREFDERHGCLDNERTQARTGPEPCARRHGRHHTVMKGAGDA